MLAYQNTPAFLGGWFESLATFQRMVAAEGQLSGFDPDQKPDPAVLQRYFGASVSALYRDEEGIFATYRMYAPGAGPRAKGSP